MESRQPLSSGHILRSAVALADREGVQAVTMRRLAGLLGYEAMTIYHYVPDKRALLGGMIEVIVEEVADSGRDVPEESLAGDWRAVVRRRCLAARTVMLRHAWAPAVIAAQVDTPPNLYQLFERLTGTMVGAGCSYELAHQAVHSLGSMLLGFTQDLFQPTADAGTSTQEMQAMAQAFPHLSRMAASISHADAGRMGLCDTQAEFEFTLALVLDGLEAARQRESASRGP